LYSVLESFYFSCPVLKHHQLEKLAKPIPDERKDDAYYERRRRNNDAAKRSRDARRMKEELIAERATRLERENGQLRGQVALLKAETARLQLLLFSRQHLSAVTVHQIRQQK
ncbi:basic region leucine zipper, partial [Cooperia oncophora]